MACTGSMVKVKGSSKAAPVVAPKPGNTPMITPITVIAKTSSTSVGSSATVAIAWSASIIAGPATLAVLSAR